MSVEVRGREERRVRVLDQRQLVGLRGDPEHDYVGVAFSGLGGHRVRPRSAEEDERLCAHLVDRVAEPAVDHRDVRHPEREFVDVLDPSALRHQISLSIRAQNVAHDQSSRTALCSHADHSTAAPAACIGSSSMKRLTMSTVKGMPYADVWSPSTEDSTRPSSLTAMTRPKISS